MKVEKTCSDLSTALAMEVYQKENSEGYFNAAVLVPLIWDKGELRILFQIRATQLSWQPGEICFPGGRIETIDESPISAAVRETSEELGIEAKEIKIIGPLHEVLSPIGVRLYPAVGYISDINRINASPDEVAEVFTVPLDFLLATEPTIGHMESCTRPLADFPFELLSNYSPDWKSRKTYQVLFYKYGQHVIWGLTAQVLYNFLQIYKKHDIQMVE
jgi:coenzyme A diphosphatase NUDT7